MTRTLTINMIMIFTKAIKDTLSPFEMSLKFQIFWRYMTFYPIAVSQRKRNIIMLGHLNIPF